MQGPRTRRCYERDNGGGQVAGWSPLNNTCCHRCALGRLVHEAPVIEWVHRISGTLASASHRPVQAGNGFREEIRQVTVGFPEVRTLPMRVILSEMLSATAMDMDQGSPRRAWLVDLSAVLHDLNS